MQIIKRAFTTSALITGGLAFNTVTYTSQDGLDRQVHFTAGTGKEPIASINLTGYSVVTVDIPERWHGMSWAVIEGEPNYGMGMLAEFEMNSDFYGLNFFDVSAIDGPLDVNNIKMIVPKNSGWPVSGCQSYPGCDNCYNAADDDAQTKSTPENEFIVYVGTLPTTTRSRARGDVPIAPV